MQLLLTESHSIVSQSNILLEVGKIIAFSSVWVGAMAFIVWKKEQSKIKSVA